MRRAVVLARPWARRSIISFCSSAQAYTSWLATSTSLPAIIRANPFRARWSGSGGGPRNRLRPVMVGGPFGLLLAVRDRDEARRRGDHGVARRPGCRDVVARIPAPTPG